MKYNKTQAQAKKTPEEKIAEGIFDTDVIIHKIKKESLEPLLVLRLSGKNKLSNIKNNNDLARLIKNAKHYMKNKDVVIPIKSWDVIYNHKYDTYNGCILADMILE